MTMLKWGAASDTGRLRQINQDSALIADNLFAVADGMGGHAAGEVAAQVAVESLRATIREPTTEALIEGVRIANRAIFDRASEKAEYRGMGTTLSALALVHEDDEERIAVVNVGDSRVYLMHDGELSQLTEDHSLVGDLVRQGELSPEQARNHPQRNIVTRALGIDPDVEVDSWQITPYAGDRYLLCSDGLVDEVEDEQIASTLRRVREPEDTANELVRVANEQGGRDNITCVVVDVVDDDGRARSASAALADEPPPRRQGRTSRSSEGTVAGGGVAVATRPPEPAGPPPKAAAAPRLRFTWRVVGFALALVLLAVAVVGALAWYARGTYYVGFADGRVAIFQGRPGGFLWFDPTEKERTDLTRDELPGVARDAIDAEKEHGDLDGARRYVDNLAEQVARRSSSASTTTTTTVPPPP